MGLRDPSLVVINLQSVGAYTVFHLLAFFAVGVVAAVLAAEAEHSIHVLWWVAEFFIVFEFAFYAARGAVAHRWLRVSARSALGSRLGSLAAGVVVGGPGGAGMPTPEHRPCVIYDP